MKPLLQYSKNELNGILEGKGKRRMMNIIEDYSKGVSKEEIQAVVNDFEKKLNSINSVMGE
jgi:hypothetical protein